MNAPKHVLLLIESSSQYGRSLLAGIAEAICTKLNWTVHLGEYDIHREPPTTIVSYRCDGIISRITNPWLSDYVKGAGLPLVDLSDRGVDFGFHSFRSDDLGIGRMAAEYFIERGFSRFAYLGFSNEVWSSNRKTGFLRALHERGMDAKCFESPMPNLEDDDPSSYLDSVERWTDTLQRPIAFFCCNDQRGSHILRICRDKKWRVPDEIAVLGVDDDEVHRKLTPWPLSSVIPGAEKIGYLSAFLLEELMNGRSSKPRLTVVAPIGVASRQSTEIVSLDDRELAQALLFVQKNALSGISVNDILKNVPISRTALEKGFQLILGRTPKAEIRHLQVLEATRLLQTTNLRIHEIAERCGFKHPEYMSVVFKRETGKSPGMIREKG